MKRSTNDPSRRSFNGHTRRAPGTEHEPGNMLHVGGGEERQGRWGWQRKKNRRKGDEEEVMGRTEMFGESCIVWPWNRRGGVHLF